MDKEYRYKNGYVYVTLPRTCNRDELKKATEEFLKKVVKGGSHNGNGNTGRNIGKE